MSTLYAPTVTIESSLVHESVAAFDKVVAELIKAERPQPSPPGWAQCVVRFMMHSKFGKGAAHDLEELYERDVDKHGAERAKWNYAAGALGLVALTLLKVLLVTGLLALARKWISKLST